MSDLAATERAPAKINLDLRILSREPDGYHRLETVFQALELHDLVEARPASALTLEIEGDIDVGPARDNLVLRAARAFDEAAPGGGRVHLRLVKRIPAGAGLGGGSSDAAATLRALNELAGRPLAAQVLVAIGAALGSDVPFFLCGSPLARAEGRGELLSPLRPLPPAPVLVVDPGFPVATRDAFRWWDERHPDDSSPAPSRGEPVEGNAQRSGEEPLAPYDFESLYAGARNDFEDVVFDRHPALATVRSALASSGARFARLSGSGSCVYGLFGDDATAERAAEDLGARLTQARIIVTRTAG